MSYSFLYTAAALLGLLTPMDQALMSALENPSLERGGEAGLAASAPLPPPLPMRPKDGRWRIEGEDPPPAAANQRRRPPRAAADPQAQPQPQPQPQSGRRPAGYALHLASYLSDGWANRGWQELKRRIPALAGREPDFRQAEVPSLGAVVRLTVGRYGSLAEAAGACAELRRAADYCAPLPFFE